MIERYTDVQISDIWAESSKRRRWFEIGVENLRRTAGNELAEALERYQEASEVDPYDPDPVYQSGMCLLEMGAYAKSREAFEEGDRLAAEGCCQHQTGRSWRFRQRSWLRCQ